MYKNKLTLSLSTLFLSYALYSQEPSRLDRRLQEDTTKNMQKDIYALFITGDNVEGDTTNNLAMRNVADLSNFYKTFLDLGVDKNNIFILDEEGDSKSNNHPPFIYPADDKATKDNIKKVLNYLGKKIDNEDLFFLYITGHGGSDTVYRRTRINRYIHVVDGELLGYELKEFLKDVKPEVEIVLADVCYAGVLKKYLIQRNLVLILSCEEYERADGITGTTYGSYFAEALKDSLSIGDAFEYAKKKHNEYHKDTKLKVDHTPNITTLLNPYYIFIK